MKNLFSIPAFILLLSFACSTKKEKRSYTFEEPQKIEAGPTYQALYHEDSVELETVKVSGKIDQYTAVKLIANSSKGIKADYLNCLMETYKTVSPAESRLEPLFDAEHMGKFIVWQAANKNTKDLRRVFRSIQTAYKNGDEETKIQLIRYGVLQSIILESRELDVNYNVAYMSFLGGIGKEFYDLLDEMETGRS